MTHAPGPHGPIPSTPHHPGASPGDAPMPHSLDPQQVMATRELFWQNVIREMLTSLSMICALRPARPPELPEGAGVDAAPAGADEADQGMYEDDGEQADDAAEGDAAPDAGSPQAASPAFVPAPAAAPERADSFDAQLFDGRLAVLTRRGERIPIADVFPLFACGIDTPRDRVLSVAIECTVFQIRTPAGEVYTLPLHEIATFQALSPELMRRLSQMARRQQERDSGQKGLQQPFGFAAFTSISRETPPPMTEGAQGP
jgi:hypothetical protein